MLMFGWCLVEILKMKCDQDLLHDLKKLLWQDELNPRVRCAFGNVFTPSYVQQDDSNKTHDIQRRFAQRRSLWGLLARMRQKSRLCQQVKTKVNWNEFGFFGLQSLTSGLLVPNKKRPKTWNIPFRWFSYAIFSQDYVQLYKHKSLFIHHIREKGP